MDTVYSATPKMFGVCTVTSRMVPDSFYADTPYTLSAVYQTLSFMNFKISYH
jgi:GDP-D-mannose dehydratase